MAPCNGTQQWHHVHSPKVGRHPPPQPQYTTMAPCDGTEQWHHVHSPKVGRHPPPQPQYTTMAPCDGTEQWHHVRCTLQWHPGATSNPPKWFVALPPIGSKNPYSYRYLGKNVLAKDASHVRISHGTFVCPGMGSRNWLRGDLPALGSFWFGESFSRIHWRTGQVSLYETILLMFCLSRWIPFQNKKSKWTESHENIQSYINILKITTATTTATSLKPPPAFVFTSICYKYFMNAECLGVVAVASSPLLSAAGLAAGLAARLLPRLHLCLMETAISANWTSWIMNRYVISYESKTNVRETWSWSIYVQSVQYISLYLCTI